MSNPASNVRQFPPPDETTPAIANSILDKWMACQETTFSRAPKPVAPIPAGFSPFNIDRAIQGAAFIHKFDAGRITWRQHVTREIRHLDHPEHPAILVWSRDEWLVYPDNEEGFADLDKDFYMVDGAAPYQRKMAQCIHCGEAIVQWMARPEASWTHAADRVMVCGVGMDQNLAAPAPDSVFDPNSKGVR